MPAAILFIALTLGAHVVMSFEAGRISQSRIQTQAFAERSPERFHREVAQPGNLFIPVQPMQETVPSRLKPEASPGVAALSTHAKETEQDPYHHIIAKAARTYGVETALIKAIIFAESGYNPRAVSKRGAMVLMQLMPKTAEAMGVTDGFNPEHNILGGVKYFKYLVTKFEGDISLALAAYNAGIKNVRKHRGVPPFEVTKKYILKVMKYYRIYKEKQNNA